MSCAHRLCVKGQNEPEETILGTFVFFRITNLICKPKENLIGSESRPSYCSGLRASVSTYSVPDPIQLLSKPWQHGTSSDLSSKVKAHCAAASISHYCGTEQMQNLDWNKCFQRVSDAGQHFRLCSPPLVGMYLCSLPSDHPGRLGRRVHQQSPAAAWCSSLKWMRAGVDIKQDKLRVRFHQIWVLYTRAKKEPRHQAGRDSCVNCRGSTRRDKWSAMNNYYNNEKAFQAPKVLIPRWHSNHFFKLFCTSSELSYGIFLEQK